MSIKTIEKGYAAERKTRLVLNHYLENTQYRIINNLFINSSRTTQIDHVIVSKYGIFVIETKYSNFLIYGSKNDDKWTGVYFKHRHIFQNPLRQNYLHKKSIAEYLNIDYRKIFSLVVYWGECSFETQMPTEIVKGKRVIDYINNKTRVLFSDNEVIQIHNDLIMLKIKTPVLSNLHHAMSLKKRYDSTTTCPKCGGMLIKRTARKGKWCGQEFLGCEKYPLCKYKKQL